MPETPPRFDVTVLGGANYDYLIRGATLPTAGETIEGHSFHEAPGGKGANQAVAAARLGSRVTFIARIGRDARGDELHRRLQTEGVDLSRLIRDPEAPTGVALIVVDARGQKQICAFPGANRRLTITDVEAATVAIRSSRVLLTQLEIPLDCLTAALRTARTVGVPVVLDAAPAMALPPDLLCLVNLLRANAAEATALTGRTVKDRETARAASRMLLSHGVGAVVLEAGPAGNLLVWATGERWLPKIPVTTVDATGAGDAFAAALAICLAENRSLEEAATVANAAAALATTVLGAQAGLPRRDDVMALLRKPNPMEHP